MQPIANEQNPFDDTPNGALQANTLRLSKECCVMNAIPERASCALGVCGVSVPSLHDHSTHEIVAQLVSAILMRRGGALLVGSNAWRLVERKPMRGDLDFVVYDPEVVYSMTHEVHNGACGPVATATVDIRGISVDISTMDGTNLNDDVQNRSCVTSVVALAPEYRVHHHLSELRVVPVYANPHAWVRHLVRTKGERVFAFWQKKLSAGVVWGCYFA